MTLVEGSFPPPCIGDESSSLDATPPSSTSIEHAIDIRFPLGVAALIRDPSHTDLMNDCREPEKGSGGDLEAGVVGDPLVPCPDFF